MNRIYNHKELKSGDFLFFMYDCENPRTSIDYGIVVGPESEDLGFPVRWLMDPTDGPEDEFIDHIASLHGKLYIMKRDIKFNDLFL